jgi:hypothetical protein
MLPQRVRWRCSARNIARGISRDGTGIGTL